MKKIEGSNLLTNESKPKNTLAHLRKPAKIRHQEKAVLASVDCLVSNIAAIDRCLFDANQALLAAQYVVPGRIQIIFTNERSTQINGVRYFDRTPVVVKLYRKRDGSYSLRGVRPKGRLESERPKGEFGRLPNDRQTTLILRNIEKLMAQREVLCKLLAQFRYTSEMALRKTKALLAKQPKILTDLERQIPNVPST